MVLGNYKGIPKIRVFLAALSQNAMKKINQSKSLI